MAVDMTIILTSIRKLVGAGEAPSPFDPDLLIFINSAFSVLTQIGVGAAEGFVVAEASKWSDFLPVSNKLEMVKAYVYLKVRLIFDPPASSAAIDAISKQITEYETRIFVEVDPELVIPSTPSDGGDTSA